SEGTHRRLWEALGAHPETLDERHGLAEEVSGYRFAVWAPNALRISVVGDFCSWDPAVYPMRRLGSSGVWEIFVPEVRAGSVYKFEIATRDGLTLAKADPAASWAERPPGTASRLFRSSFTWGDEAFMASAAARDVRREPMAIYEVHLGSWSGGGGQEINYRELAPQLVEHAKSLGFNYLELMPVAEHPYGGSWGYQITGYFAPTARYGDPDDFRFFVDYCHRHGVGVILDWVPAHFVKDAHGLGRFDGTALYEHEDPRRGEHPDWGTYIFNYGRFEVKNFLVANALYWFDAFHVDGLRTDAVASMLYLDYSREPGKWLPNAQGGRENLEAMALLREVSRLTRELYPGRFLIAEESTAWPGVTERPEAGGLGFDFKWNMGWMHDTLGYFSTDPLFRSSSHDALTFGMAYEYSEAYVNPLSHDEVVHGKGSLLHKMSGDAWRQMANLRALLAFQWTRPGKVLLFMGSELAPAREWNHETGLDRYLEKDPAHRGVRDLVAALGQLYQSRPCLWRLDHEPAGFRWIACH
ncbi:MAG: 1,4-alpha-glucan branching protein GlgB, partial [Acidobacteriota bacterium]